MNKRTEAMIRLKERGSSYAQIAAIYGISRQRVFQIVRKGNEKLTNSAKNPLNQPSEAQGRGLKSFLVRLLGRLRK